MTTTRLEDLLRLADLSDETNRLVLADALEDAGFPSAGQALRANLWFVEGFADAMDCCKDLAIHGQDVDPDEMADWSEWALRGETVKAFAERLGLAADLQDEEDPDYSEHPAWAAACGEYDRGGNQAAEDFAAEVES